MKIVLWWMIVMTALLGTTAGQAAEFNGNYCSGRGDVEYLKLIDRSFEFFHPTPDQMNISMLYHADWDVLIEGQMWDAWWIQNSYGPTYCALPFLQEPWLTILQHSQDLWFNVQGDGTDKASIAPFHPEGQPWIVPDGCLVDCARPNTAHYRQGDCNWPIHDWAYEFTAAGVIMQGELLLITRDKKAIGHYLPKLERACNFIEDRRDPKNNLFLMGPAANLLAPSYAGTRNPDGTYGKAYLAGMSVTYAAALDRMVELFKLTGDKDKLAIYEKRRQITRDSLSQFITDKGYFVKYIEPDGTKHGVLGQDKYGYLEASVNVDAVAHRVVDQQQAEKIYWSIATLPEIRPYDFLITNYPSLDDLYYEWGSPDHTGLMEFGRWVNGGIWHTMEARAIMAYYRVGKHEDVRKSFNRFMPFIKDYQMDAPLTDFGQNVWFRDKITNFCYDALGIPAAAVRGLFEYVYKADRLELHPHIPGSISEYQQKEPIRFGSKKVMISCINGGSGITSLKVNGKEWKVDSREFVSLPYDKLPDEARVEIVLGNAKPESAVTLDKAAAGPKPAQAKAVEMPETLKKQYETLLVIRGKGSANGYEKAFLLETIKAFEAYRERSARDAAGEFSDKTPEKRAAILKMYEDAATAMYNGYSNLLKKREKQN